MTNQQILRTIGLNANESTVYLGLLELGPSLISKLSEYTGLHRPMIYRVMPGLINRGLVTVVPKGKQKRYLAESPDKLNTLFEDLALQFQNILPVLEKKFAVRSKKPIVKFLEGKKGISFVFEDMARTLKSGDAFYIITSLTDSKDVETESMPPLYQKVRFSKNFHNYMITNEVLQKAKPTSLFRSVKVVPKEYGLFDYRISQVIYGDKIAYLDYNTETSFIVENSHMAEFQKKVFKLLYDKL